MRWNYLLATKGNKTVSVRYSNVRALDVTDYLLDSGYELRPGRAELFERGIDEMSRRVTTYTIDGGTETITI